MEELASSNLKNDQLFTEVLYKIEPNFFLALDIVSKITEIREMNKIVSIIRKRNDKGCVDRLVSRVDVKDPEDFKRRILEQVVDVPEGSSSGLGCLARLRNQHCLSFCSRQTDKTQS